MKWELISKKKFGRKNFDTQSFQRILLDNRGLKNKDEIESFFNSDIDNITAESVGINRKDLEIVSKRINKSILNKEKIIIFGDYDVDGICASAILWETFYQMGADVTPYIPNRIDEGYGLSVLAIDNARLKFENIKLIITVDNGIVANDAVDYAKTLGIEVIITDHHISHEDKAHKLPNAFSIIHTTQLCGAGVAWMLSQYLNKNKQNDHLGLAALATIADMVPLVRSNRTIVINGLSSLRKTDRIGLKALFDEAGIVQEDIGVYEIGHVISPRLNAAGRMASAMDSLRLICTKDKNRAGDLAKLLGDTNRLRQIEMNNASESAITMISKENFVEKKIFFLADESYQQGVIGLIAGKIVEKYYRPSIVVSKGEKYSKGSVRSVKGFNIIEFLRMHSDHFVNLGGHPMAAGFTVETTKIEFVKSLIEESIGEHLKSFSLEKSISIDCEIDLEIVSRELFLQISKLSPFGVGNPEPVFVSRNVEIYDIRQIGRENKHLKLKLKVDDYIVDAVGFGLGERFNDINKIVKIDAVFTIDENIWNGRSNLQLKIRDLRVSE